MYQNPAFQLQQNDMIYVSAGERKFQSIRNLNFQQTIVPITSLSGLGLSVAIPAVLAYNICVRFNRGLAHDLQDQAHGLLIDTMLQQETAVKTETKATQQSLVGGQA